MKEKYYLKCAACGHITPDFGQWFKQYQTCPKCEGKHAEVWYNSDYKELSTLWNSAPESFWHYNSFLPLNDAGNKISCNEGAVPLENWDFLQDFAEKKYGVKCKVFIYRNDLNGGTGTFKDVAAALAAGVLKEHGVKQYVVASTGNTATAFARYLALAGIHCSVFIPDNTLKSSEAYISAFGQTVYRVNGDYAFTKSVAAKFARDNNILISSGNIDPLRVEAKKTMVFEWLRQIKKMPDVYIQAISGGTGPIAIDKGVQELSGFSDGIKNPRFIMVQPDKCAPMAMAWDKAEKNGFPEGFEKDYPIIDNPQTCVPTLGTGNPATYPLLAGLVKKSGGTFVTVDEDKLVNFGKLMAFERKVLFGPASAVCMAGFFKALEKNLIKNGETVLVNLGEGVMRAPDFVYQMMDSASLINGAEECTHHEISDYRQAIWDGILA